MSKNNIPYTNKTFQEKINIIHGQNKILVLGNYINNHTKIKVKCSICNKSWEVLPMQLTRSNKPTSCPYCSKFTYERKTTSQFKQEVFNLVSDEYTVLGEYINNKTKIEINHNICNKSYTVMPKDFLAGYRCPYCSHGHERKTTSQFKQEVFNLVSDEYTVLGEYTGCDKYINIKHNRCGFEFKVLPRNFLSNSTRCPACSNIFHGIISKDANKIKKFLDKNEIIYEQEKSYITCKLIRSLKFDFYIPDYDLLIEFDGIQHFNQPAFMSSKNFNQLRLRDSIKNKWCIDNNKSLLRLDPSNIRYLSKIWNLLLDESESSTTIEKYNLYLIIEGNIIYDNNRYKLYE